MNRRRTAAILIVCALVLAIGAYILFSDSAQDVPTHRQVVAPPEKPASAPSWVNKGQKAQPDYSSATTKAHNATPVPKERTAVSKTKVLEVREDNMVTFTFVESLADFMLHRFLPQNMQGRPATLASTKSLNMYYGQDLDGFDVNSDDIRMARKTVLDYAFTPKMIRILYDLYTPVLMAHIVDTAATDEREYKNGDTVERRTLTNAETATMLRLNALQIEQTATAFRAIANDSSITELAGKYLGAAKAVERANLQLQNAMADETNTSKPSLRLKQAIIQREQIKKSVISRLKKACSECPDSDLFYLAQWSYRRVLGEPNKKLETFGIAADVLDDLAKRFQDKANELE